MTPAQIGKNDYRAQIARLRSDEVEIRRLLERLIESTDSAVLQSIAGRIALVVVDEDECITRLDEIGRSVRMKYEG